MKRSLPPSDLLLGVVALAIAVPSLAYPASWDSSVHQYVAREWLERGAMPYRDAFDHKTPGIYALHALSMVLPGPSLVVFHALEIGWALALGLVCAWLTAPPRRAPEPGVRGVALLSVALLVFGCLDYWNTGQGELACTTLATASILVARRGRDVGRAAAQAGVLGSLALLMKPTALPLLAIAAFLLARRAGRGPRARRVLARFIVGLVAPGALVAAYFATRGALPAAIDVLVGANRAYVMGELSARDPSALAGLCGRAFRHFAPLSSAVVAVALAGLAAAHIRPSRFARGSAWLALVMLLAGFATVVAQRKFFPYHWLLAAGGAAFALANGAVLLRSVARRIGAAELAAPVVGCALLLTFVCVGYPFGVWRANAIAMARSVVGAPPGPPEQIPGRFDHEEHLAVARWIRDHSAPEDVILVRGVGAEIYLLAHRRAPGRFFWSPFLASPARAYRREAWLAEDRASIDEHPPRYVIVGTSAKSGPDSAAWFALLGYTTECALGRWSILSRESAQSRALISSSSAGPVSPRIRPIAGPVR